MQAIAHFKKWLNVLIQSIKVMKHCHTLENSKEAWQLSVLNPGREKEKKNSQHPLDHRKSKRVPGKHLFVLYWYAKDFGCVDHNKPWKILKEMGIPDHLSCLLRNLYAGQEATVRTGHGTSDWFQIGKGVHQGCILSPCLFNLYAEYIMQYTRLDESQAGIKIAGRISTTSDMQMIPF